MLGRRMLLSNLGRSALLPCLVNGRRLLRFLGFLGGAALVSGKLNLTFFPARFSVDVNLFSVAANADDFVFLVAALFRISTLSFIGKLQCLDIKAFPCTSVWQYFSPFNWLYFSLSDVDRL